MRSTCFNLLCCSPPPFFPLPPSLSCPLPRAFSSSFPCILLEKQPCYLTYPCCSSLGDCSYFPSPYMRSGNGFVFAHLYSRVFVCYARVFTHLHAFPLSIPCLFRTQCSCFSLRVLPLLPVFLFSHRVSLSLPCNSFLSLHHKSHRLRLAINHVHLHTTAPTMHSSYTFGYPSGCIPARIYPSRNAHLTLYFPEELQFHEPLARSRVQTTRLIREPTPSTRSVSFLCGIMGIVPFLDRASSIPGAIESYPPFMHSAV